MIRLQTKEARCNSLTFIVPYLRRLEYPEAKGEYTKITECQCWLTELPCVSHCVLSSCKEEATHTQSALKE